MAVTCHYIEIHAFEPKQIALALRDCSGMRHTGENLAKTFLSILDDYDITKKLYCITADSASNNEAMAKEIERIALERKDFTFNAEENLIPCFAHVINLVFQEILISKDLDSNRESLNQEAPEENDSDGDIEDKLFASRFIQEPINKLRLGCQK